MVSPNDNLYNVAPPVQAQNVQHDSTKTQGIPGGKDDSEKKLQKKIINPQKKFKDVLDEDDEESVAIESNDAASEKSSSFMSLFGSPAKPSKMPKQEETFSDLQEGLETTDPAILQGTSLTVNEETDAEAAQDLKAKTEPKVASPPPPNPLTNSTQASNQIKQAAYESPSTLFSKLSSPSNKGPEALAKKGKFNSQYAQSETDLSFVNPNARIDEINSINLLAGSKIEQTEPVLSPIQDVVDELTKLIDKMTIMETKGQTDTAVTINAPGLFKGTIVVISEFDTAKGQLNLSFENLTSQTKELLDNVPNRDALMVALSEKGYTVQNVVTTTLIEHRPIIADQPATDFGRSKDSDPRNPSKDKPQK